MAVSAEIVTSMQGLASERPVLANVGDTFYATDTHVWSVWDSVTLAWSNPASQPINSYDPGSIVIQAGQYLLQYKNLIISGTNNVVIAGELIIFDPDSPQSNIVLDGRG